MVRTWVFSHQKHKNMESQTIVVTRHKALVELLLERDIVDETVPVIEHATPEQVRGKHVIGVLPLNLAALTLSVTEIPLNMSPEDRGKELGIERLREIAGDPVMYRVMDEKLYWDWLNMFGSRTLASVLDHEYGHKKLEKEVEE
jgi:hypothetical protein